MENSGATESSLVSRVFKKAETHANVPAYHQKKDGNWVDYTWSAYASLIKRAAAALIKLGLKSQEKVCLLSTTRLEWIVVNMAAQAAGGVGAGIYQTCAPKEVAYILNHSEAPILLVENVKQYEKIVAERSSLPHLKHIVIIDGAVPEDSSVITWEAFLNLGGTEEEAEVEHRTGLIQPSDISTLIYTSGTTGPPKAVMLSNSNVTYMANMTGQMFNFTGNDRILSFLPLAHIAEQVNSIYMPLVRGGEGYFSEGMEKLMDNLKEVQPTFFFGPPRLWEKFHAALASKLPPGTSPAQLPAELKARMLDGIGLGKVNIALTGAAPVAPSVLQFFSDLGLHIYEVYGLSESNGASHVNTPEKRKFGSVGTPIPGLEAKIAEDGEILIKGPTVFMGYMKDEATTKSVLIDGWLHTGDLGRVDEDGFFFITGRKKDILITSGGKNITPVNIESSIKSHMLVGDCVVIGDGRNYLTALVTIDPDVGAALAKQKGVSVAQLAAAAETREAVQKHIDTVNADLAQVETIKKFTILPEPFSLEKGEVTPTMKVKRAHVNRAYADVIDKMYAEDDRKGN